MKKFFATFIILVLGVAVFASCGGGSNDEGTKPADEGQNIEQTENQNTEQTPAATFANYAETDLLKIGIAEGWKNNTPETPKDQQNSDIDIISLMSDDGKAIAVTSVKTGEIPVKIEDFVEQMKKNLVESKATSIEEGKASYAGIDYTTLTFSVENNKAISLFGIKGNQVINISLNGTDIDAEIEGMLNSIETK
ncbi:MAG: hypothetical protein KBC08_02870 [Caldisericia bacterium]|nr:hypothetical protein [Caldisericia bacterium]